MAFQYTYPEDRARQDAQALRYWAANAPDMQESRTYQQEPTTLGQQAVEDQRTETSLKKATPTQVEAALPKKTEMFGLDFKGMAGAPPPPDQPNRGLPLNQNPQTDYKPSRSADWKQWQQKMMQFSGAKSPAEVAAVNEQIGMYKQRRFAETWNQAMVLHQQGNVDGAAQLYQRAYDYFTNGQGATMRGDPQTGKVLMMPYHEESGVAGKAQSFGLEDAQQVLSVVASPGAFGRDPAGKAAMDWAQEQRAQQLQPSAVALQEARVASERARPALMRAQAGYTGALTQRSLGQEARDQALFPAKMTKADVEAGIAKLGMDQARVAAEAMTELQATVQDLYAGGPVFQQSLDALFPEGNATPAEVEQLRDTLLRDAIERYGVHTMPGEAFKGQIKAETEGLEAQAKAVGTQKITPEYTQRMSENVDSVFSADRVSAGKGSSDLLEQVFWGQTGAGLDQIKSYAAYLIRAENMKGRFITPTDAVNAMKAFYTHEDNVRQGADGTTVVRIPETGQIVELPPQVVVPMRNLAEQATIEAKQKLANQAQTAVSRATPQVALPTGGYSSGPGGGAAIAVEGP